MKNREAKFGILFRHWIRANPMPSASFELKDSRGKSSIAFSEVAQEQLDSAMANKSKKGNLIRVESGTNGAADYVFLRNAYAFIVIKFPGHFEIIDAETFIKEQNQSDRKSLTAKRAKEISIISVKTKS